MKSIKAIDPKALGTFIDINIILDSKVHIRIKQTTQLDTWAPLTYLSPVFP